MAVVQVPLPAVDGRHDFLRMLTRDEPLAADVDLLAVAHATEGYSCSDLDQLCKTAAMRSLEDALKAPPQTAATTMTGPDAVEASSGTLAAAVPSAAAPAPVSSPPRSSAATPSAPVVSLHAAAAARAARETSRDNGCRSGGSSRAGRADAAAAPPSPPLLTLRALTVDDFLKARAVVRPTRGRFTGVHHDQHNHPAVPAAPADLDNEDLYN